MRGDYQYGRFMCIASKYLKIAEEMKKSEKSNVKRALEARQECKMKYFITSWKNNKEKKKQKKRTILL